MAAERNRKNAQTQKIGSKKQVSRTAVTAARDTLFD